jgi:hypothetical protein
MRRLELFNEAILLVQTYFMIIFSAFVPDYRARYFAGFVVDALVCFCVLFNLIYVNQDKPKKVFNILKRRLKKVKFYLKKTRTQQKLVEEERSNNKERLSHNELIKEYKKDIAAAKKRFSPKEIKKIYCEHLKAVPKRLQDKKYLRKLRDEKIEKEIEAINAKYD